MASSDLAAASIAAGANMNSTLWTNAANEEMQQQQNKWNLEQWHRNNAYNHPSAQMQRLKAAGLNPDLLYGQNASGAMGNSASLHPPIPLLPLGIINNHSSGICINLKNHKKFGLLSNYVYICIQIGANHLLE